MDVVKHDNVPADLISLLSSSTLKVDIDCLPAKVAEFPELIWAAPLRG